MGEKHSDKAKVSKNGYSRFVTPFKGFVSRILFIRGDAPGYDIALFQSFNV